MAVIDKDKFARIMNDFAEASDKTRNIEDSMREIPIMRDTLDFFSPACLVIANSSVVVDLLEAMFDDKDKWISYWMFEQDYGRSWTDDIAKDSDGRPIILNTAEDLYDFLVKNKESDQ